MVSMLEDYKGYILHVFVKYVKHTLYAKTFLPLNNEQCPTRCAFNIKCIDYLVKDFAVVVDNLTTTKTIIHSCVRTSNQYTNKVYVLPKGETQTTQNEPLKRYIR